MQGNESVLVDASDRRLYALIREGIDARLDRRGSFRLEDVSADLLRDHDPIVIDWLRKNRALVLRELVEHMLVIERQRGLMAAFDRKTPRSARAVA